MLEWWQYLQSYTSRDPPPVGRIQRFFDYKNNGSLQSNTYHLKGWMGIEDADQVGWQNLTGNARSRVLSLSWWQIRNDRHQQAFGRVPGESGELIAYPADQLWERQRLPRLPRRHQRPPRPS